jgi:uncharacterized protein (DUF1501 family)
MKTRRDFLRIGISAASAFGAAGALSKLGEINALAAGNPSYQALVCIFLAGGNDSNNTVVPITTVQQNYSVYSTVRQGLALAQGSLLPIATKSGDTYGLHPSMPEVQTLYQNGKAAIMANVGMLVVPLANSAAYNALPIGSPMVPTNLFSHSDQTSQWQMAAPTGLSSTGWGGRLADFVQASNSGAQYPSIVNNGGCGPFCTGAQTLPGVVPASGPIGLAGTGSDSARLNGSQQVLSFDNGLKLVQAANSISNRGITQGALLSNLLASAAPLATPFPSGNPLADQLKMVARIISVRSQLGLSRQIFFCSLDGFDTHGSEASIQGPLLQQVSQGVSAFYSATVELGVDSQVTTFTTSEFNRTVMPNSSGGTDHAWGGHHLIIGSSVVGGDLYGSYPELALGNPLDVTGRGSLIPTTSVDQYAASLAAWFGVPPTSMATVLPNVVNFAKSTLSFLG